jgi:copper(I)-binding protein
MRAVVCWLVMMGVAQAAPVSPVVVTGAWARATLPHQTVGVVYLTLQSADGDVLTAADTPQAGMVMLHKTMKHGDMADMQDVESIPLPARTPVALAPLGTHIMLMDVKRALAPGDTLHLVLHFARAGAQDVAVPVRPASASGP